MSRDADPVIPTKLSSRVVDWARASVVPCPTVNGWRCSECGRSRDATDKLRRRRGLLPLRPTAVVCSRECGARRMRRRVDDDARIRRELRGWRSSGEWRCAVCGCDHETMMRRRRRRGLLITVSLKTCTPECGRKRLAAVADEKKRRWRRG